MSIALRLFFCLLALSAPPLFAQDDEDAPVKPSDTPFFFFDHADEIIPSTRLEKPLFYDAGIAPSAQGSWVAWLEFQPEKGDQLWIGQRGPTNWLSKKQLSTKPGDYANPTPTIDSTGKLWLTYESTNSGNWDIYVQQQNADGEFSPPQLVSSSKNSDIAHRVAVDPRGGIWIVWQSDRNGQFDILARHFPARSDEPIVISDSSANDWEPCATVTPDGTLHVVWDEYDGTSYNVLERSLKDGQLSTIKKLTSSPSFEAHAQIASDKQGRLWVSWEEDGENWGKVYRARTPGNKRSTKMLDNLGPLHRFRKLHFAQLDETKSTLEEKTLPMPSFDLARHRTNAPAGLKNLGACYERAKLVVDGQNRPWILYRHFYAPYLGIVPATHKQENSRLYARCLLNDGWSKLFSFKEGQGDGGQRIFAAPTPDGLAAAWTSGRTDRRAPKNKNRGVELAEIKLTETAAKIPSETKTISVSEAAKTIASKRLRPTAEVAGQHYELFFGDFHRHTDISLCFAPVDGTIDDAYRYGIDAAPLDFLGITDHTHDIAMGDELSLIWWRSRKEVNRHQLSGAFIPFFSYERSRGETDHNVISLRDDMLRPNTYEHYKFWEELGADTNTFTIPHQPFNLKQVWNHKDNVHRPLLEIFQGFRNEVKEADAQVGLKGGHEVGFIASSDHLSTDASFACVWSPKPEREPIFRSLQARRTFGATAKIVLKVTCGDHWMGEKFSTNKIPPVAIEVTPTAGLTGLTLVLDGKDSVSIADLLSSPNHSTGTSLTLPKLDPGLHIFYVRVTQADGNMAWSSPFWVTLE